MSGFHLWASKCTADVQTAALTSQRSSSPLWSATLMRIVVSSVVQPKSQLGPFLAVHNSSIGDLVTHALTHWLTNFYFRHYRVTLETCDLWDIWSEWWGNMTWPSFWQFFTILTIFDIFWQFSTISTILDIFYNFWQFFIIWTIFESFDIFL